MFSNIFKSWHTIVKLNKLKDLIRHDARWAHQIALARPLKKLGIKEKSANAHQLIRERINNIIPIAVESSKIANIATHIVIKEMVEESSLFHPEYENRTYDVFINYRTLIEKDGPSANYFDAIIDVIDQVIGYYKNLLFKSLVNLLNPLNIIAGILKIPISIIEYMGFKTNNKIIEMILSILIKIFWVLLLVILSLRYSEQSELINKIIQLVK